MAILTLSGIDDCVCLQAELQEEIDGEKDDAKHSESDQVNDSSVFAIVDVIHDKTSFRNSFNLHSRGVRER